MTRLTYTLLDFGNHQRLEQWGPYRLVRPDPAATGRPTDPAAWKSPHATYQGEKGKGAWLTRTPMPKEWPVQFDDLRLLVRLAPYKHTGVFPEQQQNWNWLRQRAKQTQGPLNILNLFAYTGGATMACTASDSCHTAGTCDPATGMCTNPAKAEGATCNDGNACTTGDACRAGVCTGAAMACTASDTCHTAGTCDPTTGMCSNPAKPEGTSCDDGKMCTSGNTCKKGVCSGGTNTSCAASDQCHTAGTCDPTTGVCSNPAKPDGAKCDDGNACTTGNDTCVAGVCTGGPAVACTAMDMCHTAGTCDQATGLCSNPVKADGAKCDDGKACTTDACRAGICVGTVSCPAADDCHEVGTCDTNGRCLNPAVPDGMTCSTGICCTGACTNTMTCGGGMTGGASGTTTGAMTGRMNGQNPGSAK